MKKVAIFKNNQSQAVRLPKEFEFQGVSELAVTRQGDTVMLKPLKPSWSSLKFESVADKDFLAERSTLIEERGL